MDDSGSAHSQREDGNVNCFFYCPFSVGVIRTNNRFDDP
jgi:hypothetical protein